jgi:hypothetical protein
MNDHQLVTVLGAVIYLLAQLVVIGRAILRPHRELTEEMFASGYCLTESSTIRWRYRAGFVIVGLMGGDCPRLV